MKQSIENILKKLRKRIRGTLKEKRDGIHGTIMEVIKKDNKGVLKFLSGKNIGENSKGNCKFSIEISRRIAERIFLAESLFKLMEDFLKAS